MSHDPNFSEDLRTAPISLGFAKAEMPGGRLTSDVTILSSERSPRASPTLKPIEVLRQAHPDALDAGP